MVGPSYVRNGIESVHHRKSILEFLRAPIRHFGLLRELVRRDVAGRYRGSSLGLLWSLLHPLAMLAAFTVVFGVFLRARWANTDNSLQFSVVLFGGLIVFSFFAECVNRAPGLVVMHPNFVKKVVFPLELFPWMVVSTAAFHAAVSVVVWCAFHAAVFGNIPVSILYLPLVFLPLSLLALGASFVLSATGVYLRDIAQGTPIVVQQ
jgi:lipopolysaccharide transport system permease protein